MGLVTNFVKDLDAPLLGLSPFDPYNLRMAAGGIHFWGGVGGGKSSSAETVAGALLRAGCGAYVGISKFEDIGLWTDKLTPKHGRRNSVVVFDGENETLNFLDYLMAKYGMAGIGTVVEAVMRIIEAARRASGTASQRGGDVFWEDSSRSGLRYALPPLYAATGTLTAPDIIRFISSAPASREQVASREWQQSAFAFRTLKLAAERPKVRMESTALNNAVEFWKERWPAIPEKTRGNIVITISAALDRFNHGKLNRAFCRGTTAPPEISFGGGLLVAGMPTLTWGEDGVIAQQLLKFLWEKAVLGRNSLEARHRARPLFLWNDEAQETVNSYDAEFLSLCRASNCCTVFITQSLPNYYAKIGGDNPHDAAHALAQKFTTHVFCSNPCSETNEMAARMLGRVLTRRGNYNSGSSDSVNYGMSAGNSENSGSSSNYGWSANSSSGQSSSSHNSGSGHNSGTGNNWGENRGRGTSRNESRGYSESLEYAMEPGDFARILKTGGPSNGNEVTAVWFQAGRVFQASGTNWLITRFKQQ